MTEQWQAIVRALEAYADAVGAEDTARARRVATEVVDMMSLCFGSHVLYEMENLIGHYRREQSKEVDDAN
jgi:hypothetical protein